MKHATNTEMPEVLSADDLAEVKGGTVIGLYPFIFPFPYPIPPVGSALGSLGPELKPLPADPNDARTLTFF